MRGVRRHRKQNLRSALPKANDTVNGKTRGIIDVRRSATAASQAQTASTDSVAELLARSRAGLRGERYVPTTTNTDTNGEKSHLDTSLAEMYNQDTDIADAIKTVEQGVARDQQNVNAVAKPTFFDVSKAI